MTQSNADASDAGPGPSAPQVDSPARAASGSSAFVLVPRGGFFEGQVAVQGETRVDGTIQGSLRGSGEVILGTEARVEGLIECDVISISGEIVGPVIARRHAHLTHGARLDGDLDSPSVEVDQGAVWNGAARVDR